MDLKDLDEHTLFLQIQAIEKSMARGYATGARDYIRFCLKHKIPMDPTPNTLARYVAYSSHHIASAPKYLTGARHFLIGLYPDFDVNRSHPLVTSTIRGAKKVRADPVRRKLPLRLEHLKNAPVLQEAMMICCLSQFYHAAFMRAIVPAN